VATRIAIVGGGGGVGSSLAFNLLLAPEPYEIGLVDGHSGMARSHEMDLQQVVAAGATGSIGVALTVPVTLGGVAAIHEWELTAEQAAAVRAGADVVREALAAVDLA
jgi:malate/lactate dehydrogenase